MRGRGAVRGTSTMGPRLQGYVGAFRAGRDEMLSRCFATSPNQVLASLRKSVGTEPLGCRYSLLWHHPSLSLSLTTAAARSGPRDPSLSQGEYLENIWKRQWISKQCTCSPASQAVVTPWPLGSLRYKQTSRPLLSICLGADTWSERNPVTGKWSFPQSASFVSLLWLFCCCGKIVGGKIGEVENELYGAKR